MKLYDHGCPQAPRRATRYTRLLSPGRNALLSLSAVALIASVCFNASLLTLDAALRPTTLIAFPCATLLLISQQRQLVFFAAFAEAKAFALLLLLLVIGHGLGHDSFSGTGDEAIFSASALLGIGLVFYSGAVLGAVPKLRIACGIALIGVAAANAIAVLVVLPSISTLRFERSTGLFDDPNIVLMTVLPTLFLGIAALKSKVAPLFLLVTLGIAAGAAVLQTGSRAGTVSFICGFVPALAASIGCAKRAHFVHILTLFIAAGAVITVSQIPWRDWLIKHTDMLLYRFEEGVSRGSLLADRSRGFDLLTEAGIERIASPLGMGLHGVRETIGTLPHNSFVDSLIIGGPLALVCMAVLYGQPLYLLCRCRIIPSRPRHGMTMDRDVAACLVASVVSQAVLIGSLSVLPFKVHWLILGFVAGWLRVANCSHATTT